MRQARGFFAAGLKACAALNQRAILLTPYADQVRGSPRQDPETLVQREGRPAGTLREGEEDDRQKRERLERESTQRGIVPDATSGGSDRPQTIRQRENLRSGGSMIGGGTVAPLR